jgi:hypothetical protein
VALKSDTATEESKDQLSRDFSGRSIFDFCNSIERITDFGQSSREVRFVHQPEVADLIRSSVLLLRKPGFAQAVEKAFTVGRTAKRPYQSLIPHSQPGQ